MILTLGLPCWDSRKASPMARPPEGTLRRAGSPLYSRDSLLRHIAASCSVCNTLMRVHALPQETILNDSKVKDAARKRRAERESALTLEQRVALNAQQKERAADLQRQQVCSASGRGCAAASHQQQYSTWRDAGSQGALLGA